MRHSLETGSGKSVVILTQHSEYRKEPSFSSKLIKLLYFKYPKFSQKAIDRYLIYNDTLSYIDEEEKKGNLFVIRPDTKLPIGRIEKNKEALSNVYNTGYEKGKAVMENLKAFLEKE